jgi:hypothetical protein
MKGTTLNIKNKYIQRTKSKRFDVIFPESIKKPRRLGRYDTIEEARQARDKYLSSCSKSTADTQGKAEIETDNHFFLVAFSDTHGGHNQGLLNPNTVFDTDEGHYQPKLTKMQEWLWKFYSDSIDKVFYDIAQDVPIVLSHVGDLTQGKKYSDNHVSDRMSDQILIAYYNIKPWFHRGVRKALLLKGTSSHAFGDGSSDLLIAELLRTKYDDASIKSVYHALLQLGVEIDLAHHGPHPGTRKWTKGNVARSYLLDKMIESVTGNEVPSRLYIRGHFHSYIREYLGRFGYESDLIILPSFCGLGAYGHQATKSISYTSHGMVVFEIKNGRVKDIIPIVEKYDCRTRIYL